MEQNQNYKSARQIYSDRLSEFGLPENPQDSNKYDWNLWREFYNWLKQMNADSDYLPNPDELGFLEEIQCTIILKEYGVKVDPHNDRDWIIAVLTQRIDIRDSVLMPDDYCTIDNRIPLDIVSNDDAERLFQAIHPDEHKSWNLPLLPIRNYPDYVQIPSGKPLAKGEGVQPSSEPVGHGSAEKKKKSFLPLEMYGTLAQNVVMAMSNAYQTNPDLLTATALIGVAEAANRKATIRFANYTNTSCLWLSVIARSGYNKSEPMARMLKPIEAINKDLIDYSNKKFAEWLAGGQKGTPPPKRKILISDSTPEIRNELLNSNGLLLYRDEIFGFLKDLNRYTQSGEIETLLSIWSSKSYSVDRKTSGSYYIENPFLCVCGGIQPEMVQEAFGGKGFEGSGFIQRWLFLWLEDCKVPDRVSEGLIPKDIENKWYTLIQDLWRMAEKEYQLSGEAAEVYQRYMKETANKMNDPECDSNKRAMIAKLRIYALRLALVIHLLRNGKDAPMMVDAYTMNAAIQTCDCFQRWNSKILDSISHAEATKQISSGDLLRELVLRYNVSNQSELARLINRSQQYVSRILKE